MAGSGTSLEQEVSLGSDSRRLLIQRILASQAFGKSPRLTQFLSYVCERTLTDRADEINEQKIGEQVFERPPGYDPGQDNIVRVQASRVRQRLETYFKEEGAGEELRVIIPKGGYVPQFVSPPLRQLLHREEERLSSGETAPEVVPGMALPPESAATTSTHIPRRRRWLYTVAFCFLFLNLFGIAYVYKQGPRASFSLFGLRLIVLQKRTASPLWSQMFEKEQSTVIVPGDSGLVLYESQADKTVPLAEYLSGDVQIVPQINPSTTFDKPTSKTGYRYTTIVDLQTVSRLLQTPEALLGHGEIRYARDLKLDDLKGENAILIGDKTANPWVELFEPKMNFAFDVNRTNHNYVVTNRHPQPGEDPTYSREPNNATQRAYALLAFLPNLNRTGNILILEGTTMAGTEAASDFAFDGERLATVLQPYMRHKGELPYFEVLLQTSSIGGGAPESKVLAYRIHKD
jgi:hypothetical protein